METSNSNDVISLVKEINQNKVNILVKKNKPEIKKGKNKDNQKEEKIIDKIKNRIQKISNKFKNNDNITEYDDSTVKDGELFFTMEKCDENLREYLYRTCPKEGQGLNTEQIYDILDQLNNAFRIFESDKIIHGNLELENILVKKNEEKSVFKLSEFEFIPELINATNQYKIDKMCWYLPPEILENKNNFKIDQKTDTWSLGIIIYYLYFKEFPYNGGTCEKVLEQIKNNIRKKTNNSELDDLIDGLLNTNKEERFDWYKYLHHEFFPWRKKYELGESLGGESCYTIYKAREYLTNSEKVIKIIEKDKIRSLYNVNYGKPIEESKLEEFVKLLGEQITAMKILEDNNENTVQIFEYFNTKKEFAIVMEKCDTDLSNAFAESKNNFSLDQIKDLLKQLNNTFKIMSDNKLIHGDLKLINILIKYDNNKKPIYKLTDYGITKEFIDLNKELMRWGGALKFSAPEFLSGKDYDSSCDLWSLGIILHILFKRESPYNGSSYNEVLNDIKTKGQSHLHQLSDDPQFDHLIRRLLTFEAKNRITWKEYFEHPFIYGGNCWKHFVVEKRIGTGTYYEIYKVKSNITGEYKAIKVINLKKIASYYKDDQYKLPEKEDMKIYIDEIIEEFKISEKRRGPDKENIYTLIYEQYFQADNEFCIVEELCDGDLLRLKNDKKFNAKEIYQVFNQLNNTFKIIKEYDLYVKDLRLEEILYKKDKNGEENIYKISNFSSHENILKLLNAGGLTTNYNYKAPEILEILNESNSEKQKEINSLYKEAYLWNIGILIFLLYFEDFPYKGSTPKEILDKIKTDDMTKLNEIDDIDLKDLLKKLLKEDRKERINWNDYFEHKFFSEEKWK